MSDPRKIRFRRKHCLITLYIYTQFPTICQRRNSFQCQPPWYPRTIILQNIQSDRLVPCIHICVIILCNYSTPYNFYNKYTLSFKVRRRSRLDKINFETVQTTVIAKRNIQDINPVVPGVTNRQRAMSRLTQSSSLEPRKVSAQCPINAYSVLFRNSCLPLRRREPKCSQKENNR